MGPKIAAFFALVASIFAALFFREKASHEKDIRKGVEEARKIEKKATGALVDGLTKESEVTDEIPNDPDTDIFSGK